MKEQTSLMQIAALLEEGNIPYQFTEEAALYIQGVYDVLPGQATISVQWDVMEKAYELLEVYQPSDMARSVTEAGFSFTYEGISFYISCRFNTTIKTDPYRIAIGPLWCTSLYAYLYFPEDVRFGADIRAYLLRQQQALTAQNETAWNQSNYTALLKRHGEPAAVAEKIRQNPGWRLHPFGKYLGDVRGKQVTHLMGSHGIKAVALALQGAAVTVVDFSHENAMFAAELAQAADVSVQYVVSDILSLEDKVTPGEAHIVLMELGVLHYFLDLTPLAEVIRGLLREGGRFILHEFHPVSLKMITSTGKKHKITGNYFDPSLQSRQVAFAKHVAEAETKEVVQRKWTMGEIVTAFASAGLVITVLEEEPNHKSHDIGLPKTFTLVAEKR